MRVAITGAAGLFGQGLVAAFSTRHEVFPLTRAEADITDAEAVLAALERIRPELVVHPAGIPDLDTCQTPVFVGAADLNGDGKLDLVVANFTGSAVALHFGNGDGTFQPPTYVSPGVQSGPAWVAVGDFNGDAKPDLAVADSGFYRGGTTVSIFSGNGDGTFQPPMDYGVGHVPYSIAAADLNADGKLDLAVANARSMSVSVLLGNGNGTFLAQADYPTASDSYAFGLAAGDFNLDGKPDLVTSNPASSASASVLLGNGDGTFQKSVDYEAGSKAQSVAVADFNRDGKQDLVTANLDGDTVSILLGNGDGTFQTELSYPAGSSPESAAVGDLNRDGKLDLAVANGMQTGNGTVSILLGQGDGSFQSPVAFDAGFNPAYVAIADFNGDGKLDLAVSNFGYGTPGTTVSILLGNGDGTFQAYMDATAGNNPYKIAVGDFNADGKLDMAVVTDSGAAVLLGNGDGTFQAPVVYPTGIAVSIATGDFNGDGKLDLALGTLAAVSVLIGHGDGTFQSAVDYAVESYSSTLVVDDFNHDGAPDIAGTTGGVSVLLNTGGSFIKLTSSPNPSKQGQAVTFVVSVTASLPAQPMPSGTVTLKDGLTVLATLTLREDRAHFITSSLSAGKHRITATYSGDSHFNPNHAPPLNQRVAR